MRYKYSLPSEIRSTVEWQLEHYPEDKRQLSSYKDDLIPSPTQAYSLTPGGGGASRTTENVAMRIASSPYLRRLEQSVAAIEYALSRADDIDRRLIELVYWRREYTVAGAGLRLGLSCSGAYKRLNKVLAAVALELGYVSA